VAFGVIYVITASQVHYTSTHAEREINEVLQDFMDRLADAGFLIPDDYDRLLQALGVSGGTFSITFTVERLLVVPDTHSATPQGGTDWQRRLSSSTQPWHSRWFVCPLVTASKLTASRQDNINCGAINSYVVGSPRDESVWKRDTSAELVDV